MSAMIYAEHGPALQNRREMLCIYLALVIYGTVRLKIDQLSE